MSEGERESATVTATRALDPEQSNSWHTDQTNL
jgi:hypothetical protein